MLTQSPLSILVAEDDPEMRRLVSAALRKKGHDVEEVASGASLLERLRSEPLPRVLVTDLRMPWLDGLEALRAAGPTRWVPTLLITAFPAPDVVGRALEAGADVLAKPFDLDELCGRVAEMLRELDPFGTMAHDGYGPIRRRGP